MDVAFLLVSIAAGIHGFSFCLWLRKQGKMLGAIGVFILVFLNVALPVYRIIHSAS